MARKGKCSDREHKAGGSPKKGRESHRIGKQGSNSGKGTSRGGRR